MNKMKQSRTLPVWILLSIAAVLPVYSQTQIDLDSQSRRMDFSGAPSTKPAKSGPSLPPVCSVSEVFFHTAAPPGQNLYGCTATNSWSLLGSGVGLHVGDFAASNMSGTVQTIGQGCSSATPCSIRSGAALFTMTAPVTLGLSGTITSGTVYWYLSASHLLTAGHNSAATLSCSSGCVTGNGVTSFPPDSVPLWQTTFTANTWDAIDVATMDKRAFLSRNVIAPGSGIASLTDPNTGIQTLSTDPNMVPRYFTGSGAPTGNCTAGRDLYTDTSGAHLYFCSSTNTWTQAH